MNTNMLNIDPLGSYNQFYQPPFHPQTTIPHTQANISHTPINIPHTQANILHTQASIPHTQTTIPHTQTNVPHTQTNVPHTQTNVPHTQTNVPHTQTIPHSQAIPYTQPTIPQTHLNIPLLQPHVPIPVIQPNLSYHYLRKDYNPNIPCNINEGNAMIDQPRELESITNPPVDAPVNDDIPTEPVEEEDIKPDITKIKLKLPRKPKGKTSSYWNKKITDKDFKFFGCAVCNISFLELSELDAHVTIHSNRITSYDIRLKNLKKRKQLKKERKKKKVKNEFELDIKPEDGYIGMEKAGAPKKKRQESKKPKEKEVVEGKNLVFQCFACNKQFALSYYLKIHVRSHTGEKPYTCNTCGETFITASKMGRHKKRIHLAIRHQCRICFSFFSRFELLTKHFDKKHADQKLEGEPYDYNAILPYLTDLEDQFKVEDVKKPKTEDIWDWPPVASEGPPEASEASDVAKTEDTELKKNEKKLTELDIDDQVKNTEDLDIKLEFEDTDSMEPLPISQVFDDTYEPEPSTTDDDDDDDDVPLKVKSPLSELLPTKPLSDRLTRPVPDLIPTTPLSDPPTDDEEYFPPGGWLQSPPREYPESPPASPPPGGRKKGHGVCELCKRSFSSKSYLKVHMRTHTGEKPFACYVCGRGFITASKMHRHVLTHNETWLGEDRIKPEGADIKSEDEEEAEDNLKRTNSKIEKAKIKLLKKPNKRMDPKLKRGRTRKHCCDYCGKKFLHIETLQVHQKSHEGEELIIKCTYCLEPQLDQEARAEHEATHTGPKPYCCTLCGRHYIDRGAMLYHRKNHKPSDEKLFICDMCSKRFNSQTKLARHIVSHSSERFVLRYECPVCANMFHTRWHVQMHLKSHQKEGLILEENRNAVLAMVLQNVRKIPKPALHGPSPPDTPHHYPPDERSRICNICGEVFQHFYYLEEHLKTHGNKIAIEDLDKEEEKKYTCQVCSKSFKFHYYLKLHSFTHTKEKPFTCQQCGKGFITKGKLKRHLETHQGLKKYQCHICCKFFTRPSYMRIHVRTIHGTQDYNFRDYGVGVPLGLNSVPVTDY